MEVGDRLDGAARLLTRWRTLVSPPVLVSLVVLAVNDHVLKAWSGGLDGVEGVAARVVTGKASDVAGVALAALLIGIVSGRGRGATVAVGVGFAAIKAVPGVAEAVAPLLGGVTRRDPTDLLALVVLVAVDRTLRRPALRTPVTVDATGARHGLPARAAAGVSAVLPGLVAGTAVLTMTATSCAEGEVVDLQVEDDTVWADLSFASAGTAVSEDSGRTWARTTEDLPVPNEPDVDRDAPVACTTDDQCYRVTRYPATFETRVGDGPWEPVEIFTPSEEAEIQDHKACIDSSRPTAVVVIDDTVVVAHGSDGVLLLDRDGEWERAAVLDVLPAPLPDRPILAPGEPIDDESSHPAPWWMLAPLLTLLVSAAPVAVAARAGGPLWAAAAAVPGVCGPVAAVVVWVLARAFEVSAVGPVALGPLVVGVSVVALGMASVSAALARSRGRHRLAAPRR